MIRHRAVPLGLVVLAALGSFRAGAQSAPRHALPASAPISDIHYDVTVDSTTARTRDLAVTMHFHVAGTKPVVLALPAWSPGHYTLLWFASRLVDFTPTADGKPLAWRKLDFQTWEIAPNGVSTVSVAFRYHADAHDRAVAYTARDLAFFNGTNVFLYPVGQGFAWPATVQIHAPADWRIATGLTAGRTANTYTAANYHDFVDAPFIVGKFDFDSVRTGAVWVRLASFPAGGVREEWRQRTLRWMARLIPTEGAVFHDIPFDQYTVLQLADTIVNGGGLEHHDSQLDGVTMDGNDYAYLPFLYAHELFHAWNVKRLRPADMVPYRYDDAEPTPWLWVSEGVTDYYGPLALVRSGIVADTAFESHMAGDMATVQSSVPIALGDASLSAWIGAADGTGGIYYPKGATAGLLLDILIRDASNNVHSLDDVMRALYDSTYKTRWRGFTSADFWGAVRRFAGGRSFADFDRRYITGREPMPIDSVLALGGWRLLRDSVKHIQLGVQLAADDHCVRLLAVTDGGPAQAAGLRAGDCMTKVGDVSVATLADLPKTMARYDSTTSTSLPVTARRGTDTVSVSLPVRRSARLVLRMEEVPDANPKARQIRTGILTGRASGGANPSN
jgi:predicted metalloprotease with PDZ domain